MTVNFSKIESINDERISFFKSLRLASNRFKENGLFLVEGEISFTALLNTSHLIHAIFLEESLVEKYVDMIPSQILNGETKYLVADRTLMSEVVGYAFHQGVLALAYRPLCILNADLPLPAIALNAIENAENVGTIIRTAVCLGFSSFIVDSTSCDPFVRRAIRVSMGAVLFSKVVYVHSLTEYLFNLKTERKDLQILSLEQDASSEILCAELPAFDVLVLGNEAGGVAKELISISDRIIEIPMISSSIRSLNVGVSLGIALSRSSQGVLLES